jgi:pimeloyl-ACP methyl ester carboxylesterase
MKFIDTPLLRIAYEEHGPADGPPAVLLHGFPYAPRAYDTVAPALAEQGLRVIVPYLRGLVSVTGYNIQNIAASVQPQSAAAEHRYWYQYYLHTPRGVAGLTQDRRGFARMLWRLWSPTWPFDDATFDASAAAFDTPDFVDIVVHSYRHRFGYAPGDPALAFLENALARQPDITVPSIVLHGADDGVDPPSPTGDLSRFTGPCRREIVPAAGHNLPQETPAPFIRAVLDLL